MHIFDGENTDFLEGQIIVINKPSEWTSFDVVNKIRGLIRKKYQIKKIKVGHAGTLDPLATGVLVICTGKATKTIQELMDSNKQYEATIKFGVSTPSFDAETEPDKEYPWKHITEKDIQETLLQFTGEISQEPPLYSALKIDGKRAYKLARKGEKTKIPERIVNINSIEIKKINLPELKIAVTCSKGTYIRSLARDIGKKLNSGAYLTNLIRTSSGDFSLNNSLEIKEFENILNNM